MFKLMNLSRVYKLISNESFFLFLSKRFTIYETILSKLYNPHNQIQSIKYIHHFHLQSQMNKYHN